VGYQVEHWLVAPPTAVQIGMEHVDWGVNWDELLWNSNECVVEIGDFNVTKEVLANCSHTRWQKRSTSNEKF
jgi:hypothetical protein